MAREDTQFKPGDRANPDGRPKIEFTEEDWAKIRGMCEVLCTGEEIAAIMGVSYSTLAKRTEETFGTSFNEWYKSHSSKGKMSLRRAQFELAKSGNATMQVWLGKQILDQKDKIEQTFETKPIAIKRFGGEVAFELRHEKKIENKDVTEDEEDQDE